MFVLCDIVQNQFYANKRSPILRICNLGSEYLNETHTIFSPILYLPLQRDTFSQIRVKIVDEYNRLIDLGGNPVLLTLHLTITKEN